MSLRIRLSRGGAKKRPYYHLVVADSRSPRDGRFIEKIGSYNPMVPKDHPERLTLKEERARHWLSVGAKPSDRVARFLGQANIIEMPAQRQQTKKSQPKAKTLERLKEREEAQKAAAEAAAAPVEEPTAEEPAVEEPAVEEPAVEEPAVEEPAVEEPAAEEPVAEEAAPEEAAPEEAAPEEAAPEEAAPEEAAAADGESEEQKT